MVDDYPEGSRGLIAEGPIFTFNQDTTSISKGDAVILDGTNDFRVLQANALASALCVGVAATDSKNATPVAGDEIAIVCRGPIVKVELDGGTNDVSPGDLLVTDTDGSLIAFTAFLPPSPYGSPSMKTELDKVFTVVGIALQNHDNDGDEGLVMLL